MERGFLDAIYNRPNDLATLSVYADWGQEQGFDKYPRAEFVLVQLQLEELELPRGERQKLLARERELLAAHRDEWLAEDLCHVPEAERAAFNPEWLTFGKGFLDILVPENRGIYSGLHNYVTQQDVDNYLNIHLPNRDYEKGFEDEIEHGNEELPGMEMDGNIFRYGVTPVRIRTLVAMDLDASLAIYHILNSLHQNNRLSNLLTLINSGANLNTGGEDSVQNSYSSPLHFISYIRFEDMITDENELINEARLLIRNGASTKIKDDEGLTVKQLIKNSVGDDLLLKAILDEEKKFRAAEGYVGRAKKPRGRSGGRGRSGSAEDLE